MYRMNQRLKTVFNRFLALLAAGVLLLATGCRTEETPSQDASSAASGEPESSEMSVSAEPSARPGGQPSYDIETPPLDKLTIPDGFSIAPVQSGDPNFVPGCRHVGMGLPDDQRHLAGQRHEQRYAS